MGNAEIDFKSLFDANYQALCLYAARFVDDAEEVEDIVQNVYIRLWERMRARSEIATRAYLYTMVKNALIDRSRRKKIVTVEISAFSEKIQAFFQPESDEEAIVDVVLSTINSLPEKAREIVNAVFIKGKKYKEVAEELNISVNTVKTQLARSLRILRRSLSEENMDLYIFLLMPLG